METKREIWVDDVKVIACILVVLGHFFQSMTKAGILPVSDLYLYFNQTIYYFHVPLFFICSGYLYQKYGHVYSLNTWSKNVVKKFVVLGVPYFVFSIVTWLLKTAFSGVVNDKLGGLLETLFLHPASPYWYLYVLFFIFLVTPAFRKGRSVLIAMGIALAGKIVIVGRGIGCGIYAIDAVLANEIWFVGGMCLTFMKREIGRLWIGVLSAAVFVALSVPVFRMNIADGQVTFVLGALACLAVIGLTIKIDENGKQNRVFAFLAKYTLPIFLMHTLFAAPFRVLLLKAGITSSVIHVSAGIVISFAGSIASAEIMNKIKALDFLLYPGKYIKTL